MDNLELTKTNYNLFKIWGALNLILGIVALLSAVYRNSEFAAILGAVGLIGGGILISTSKGPFISKTKIKIPVNSENK
ncbi:hypothetical protein [Microbulbifer epialgicus]|uniref:Uncharacterized protein n=1 Tax=Microbulbifer epialgicus TaxID=393907 RepID=A0ABV4NUS5_9GAMM